MSLPNEILFIYNLYRLYDIFQTYNIFKVCSGAYISQINKIIVIINDFANILIFCENLLEKILYFFNIPR